MAACGGDELATLSGPAGGSTGPPTLVGPATSTTAAPTVIAPVLPPTTVRPGGATGTTVAPSATAPPTTRRSGLAALAPATPGTYRYDTTGFSRVLALTVPYPAVTTLVVDPAAGTSQRSTRDLRDAARSGPLFETTLDYRSDGVYLVGLKLTVTVLLITQSAELRPPSPVLLIPKDAAPGLHRELDVPTESGTARLVLDVRRAERVTIGGQGVDTLVVQLVTSLAGPIGGSVDITVWLAPAQRLWVKERFVADAATADGALQFHSEYDATLQRLAPG